MAQEARELRAAIKRERADLAGMMESIAYKADVVADLRVSVGAKAEELENRSAALFPGSDGTKPERANPATRATIRKPADRARQRQFFLVATGFVAGLVVARVLMRRR